MKTVVYCQLGGELPERIRLLPLGEVVLGDGRQPFVVTEASLANIMSAWKARGNDMVIDYEHQTVTGQEAPAAGWIKELSATADGLWARVVWTDRAREYLERKEYRYFSPVVRLGEKREVVDLLHVALTNYPAISNLEPLILRQQDGDDDKWELSPKPEGAAGEVQECQGERMIRELREIFGLPEGAAEERVLAKARELSAPEGEWRAAVPEDICTFLGLPEDYSLTGTLKHLGALKAAADRAVVVEEEIARLHREGAIQRGERLLQEALKSKKTTPAELDLANGRLRQLAYNDPDFFGELILRRRENFAVPGRLGVGVGESPGLNQEEGAICDLMGITPEAYIMTRLRLEKGER